MSKEYLKSLKRKIGKYFLNNEVKLTKQDLIDENIELLVVDGQLKGVVKDVKGSPNAEIVYNVNLSKANE